MAEKPSVLRETDDEARKLARTLLRSARSGALAVIEPVTGFPFASRTLVGMDTDGSPVILVSALSTHTRALRNDPRASLLVGEPGKGDPLAHPRLTVQVKAESLARETNDYTCVRTRFIMRHPKANLYVDFPDFQFLRLVPQKASLNGGFGKAFLLTAEDLAIRSKARRAIEVSEMSMIDRIKTERPETAARLAARYFGSKGGCWSISGIDAAGIDLTFGDRLERLEFESELEAPEDFDSALAKLLKPGH